MLARGGSERVPEDLGIHVGVAVDEAGGDGMALGVDLSGAGVESLATRAFRPSTIPTLAVNESSPDPSMIMPLGMTRSWAIATRRSCVSASIGGGLEVSPTAVPDHVVELEIVAWSVTRGPLVAHTWAAVPACRPARNPRPSAARRPLPAMYPPAP